MNKVDSSTSWYTTHQVAEVAGIKYEHLWTYRKRGVLPEASMHIGNKPLWEKSVIDEWAKSRRRIERPSVEQ